MIVYIHGGAFIAGSGHTDAKYMLEEGGILNFKWKLYFLARQIHMGYCASVSLSVELTYIRFSVWSRGVIPVSTPQTFLELILNHVLII